MWYAGSFAIGAVAGALGDRDEFGLHRRDRNDRSRPICEDHIERLPAADSRSRAILEQMKHDEMRAWRTGRFDGRARRCRWPCGLAMRLTSRVMTRSSYWL